MNQPTEEQKRWLWRQCGLEWKWNHNPECNCGAVDDDDEYRSWHKDGKLATRFWHEDMAVDLNNLFRYAVPKLDFSRYVIVFNPDCGFVEIREIGINTINYYKGEDKVPAVALFWAIYKALGGK